MHMIKVPGLLLVLLCCELCSTIKVPNSWKESANSEVKNVLHTANPASQLQNGQLTKPSNQQPIPIQYFEYTAQKPSFAADIAAFHGVQNPRQHYKAYPVRPHTGKQKPALGIHHMLDKDKIIFKPFQNYVHQNEESNSYVKPTTNNYEIFHPYQAEEPALQQIYKDPVLTKIRNDLQDSKDRLQAYEQQAGEPNIAKDEYLESPKKTDGKLFPHKNVPARYEIHRPQGKLIHYKGPPRDFNRDNALDKKLKHPWNQNAKIRPVHYRPLQNHIHHLRQQHAMKYDDERNEYPQKPVSEDITESQDGYDIYEKGKNKYIQLRNNLDESVNQIVRQNRPEFSQKLELQNNEPEDDGVKDEFIPVKNYAQVRKTETFRHLPKKAAFDDAETYEEVINAPRLREAVKSTKAQTVYSEEGYEDSAYDHAGEQKHASDHEGHGGFLKEHENSGGLYKIPTVSGKYQDGRGSEYRDKTEHGKKWKNNDKDDEEEIEDEDSSEDDEEEEESVDAAIVESDDSDTENRIKRQGFSDTDINSDDDNSDDSDNDSDSSDSDYKSNSEEDRDILITINSKPLIKRAKEKNGRHGVNKREVDFKVPIIYLNSTLSIPKEVSKLETQTAELKKENLQEKYPYYFQKMKGIHRNSPLRYAENLKFIPNKSNGGSEFYDSRSRLECPEVDDDVDPVPEKLKNGENPTEEMNDVDDEESKTGGKKSFETIKEQPRLKGLGDKIDCFKAKYFGENPLDSPFFNEEIISNPEPIVAPELPTYKLKTSKEESAQKTKINNVIDSTDKLREAAKTNIYVLLDKLRSDQSNIQESLNKTNGELNTSLYTPQGILATKSTQQANVYTDILKNIKNNLQYPKENDNVSASLLNSNTDSSNLTYNFFQNKEEVTKLPPKLRKKRAAPFLYEPYKVIKDSQIQDSKKTTTTSNIGPLIKQLQSSRVADRVSRSNKDDKLPRQKTNSRTYVDIGRKERTKSGNENINSDATFVDVSLDHRRGEPRYELRPPNHKSEYTPVENKRTMSVEAYVSRTTTEQNKESTERPTRIRQRLKVPKTKTHPYDVSPIILKTVDTQNVAASNAVKNTVTSATPETITEDQENSEEDFSEENFSDDNYEDEDDYKMKKEVTTTTTTTTTKPSLKKRIKFTTTTEKTLVPEYTTEMQRLKLVTRFRNYKPDDNSEIKVEMTEQPVENKNDEKDDIAIPKYIEKKKKTHSSTLVTDTKKYGDDDEKDMRKEEVDALIGVKHNKYDYMPMYEKVDDKEKQHQSRENEKSYDESDEVGEDDYDDVNDDEDDDDENHDEYYEEEEKSNSELKVATTEPTKRTLARTTDAPPTTVATYIHTTIPTVSSRNIDPKNKPIVTRKRIEIHNELPVNKSSPHVTQFKQDFKEVEIIKEMRVAPKRKPQKNSEALDLYKDDDLAKSINNLGHIEIFRDNLDLDNGPKHGGNYRQATKEDLRLLKPRESRRKLPKDAETSQSENTKHVELDEYAPKRLHRGNSKSSMDIKRTKHTDRRSKIIEQSDPTVRAMHGGNLKYDTKRRGGQINNGRKNEKLIELDENYDEDYSPLQEDDYKSHSSRNEKMHGGNYKSAKLVAPNENNDDIKVLSSTKNLRKSGAIILNSFAQAVPIMTSTPGYIVDPSKRMYYYVST